MKATLIGKREVAADTMEFAFSVPDERAEFLPGQYLKLRIPTLQLPDKKADRRKFTIVNSPTRTTNLLVTTRTCASPFKQTLCMLPIGSEVEISGIKGKLLLSSKRPLVFVAGGIGIAPFMSMLHYLEDNEELHDVTLLYFNRTKASAAYVPELQGLAARHPGFSLVLSYTRENVPDAEHERLSRALLRKHVQNWQRAEYYVVGTTAMVDDTVKVLRGAGIPSKQIHEEDFSGY